jgi:hypothetical protein
VPDHKNKVWSQIKFLGKLFLENRFWTFFLSNFETEKNFPTEIFVKKKNKLFFLLKETKVVLFYIFTDATISNIF